MKTIAILILVFLTSICKAQTNHVFLDWESKYGVQEFHIKSVVKTDSYRDTYVIGATKNVSGNYDALVVKYSSDGDLIWAYQYDGVGNGNDVAIDIVIDSHCNSYITGTTYISGTDSNDVLTIMLDSTGTEQWVETYNGNSSLNDGGVSIYLQADSLFIAGTTMDSTNFSDILVLKYLTDGTFLWANNYDHNNLNDIGQKITRVSGTILIGGATEISATSWDYIALTFNPNTGAYISNTTTSGGTSSFDMVNAITHDGSGNIFLTGTTLNLYSSYDMYTVKIDSNLTVIWSATYSSNGTQADIAKSIVVDAGGNVYITGFSDSTGQGTNFKTIKYNNSGGIV